MNKFVVNTSVAADKQSSSAASKLANAKKKRASSTRKTISFAPSENRPEILLEDIKKSKNKTQKFVASANGIFHTHSVHLISSRVVRISIFFSTDVADKIPVTSKVEKAKLKRQSAQRKTISCPRPKIFLDDGNDSKVPHNLAVSGKVVIGELLYKSKFIEEILFLYRRSAASKSSSNKSHEKMFSS